MARQFDLDSGAASYHLRKLAEGGLIEEDTGRGNRRDRWWRALHAGSQHDPAESGGAEGAPTAGPWPSPPRRPCVARPRRSCP
ncbi:hypothetical protein [Streptomyces sp. KL116D]|uniref:hypothetical protein n=1 Tax=Streptomyces sp. KL116D TaxID=3045152 RepID=UPI003558CC8C